MQEKLTKLRHYLNTHRRMTAHLLVMFFLSNFVGFLFGSIYSTQPYHDIPIAVINHDSSATAESFVKAISENDTFAVTYGTEDQQAEELIYNGKVHAAVIIPADFSDSVMNGREATVMLIMDGAMSPATNQIRNTINSTLTAIRSGYLLSLAEGKFNMPMESAKRTMFPIGVSTQLLGNPVSNSAYMTVEGYILTVMQVGCFCVGCLVYESKNLRRFLAKGAVVSAVGILTGITGILVQIHFFDIPYLGSPMAGFLLIALTAIGCTYMGLAANRLTKGDIEDKIFLSAIFSLTLLLSGYAYPISAMPAVFQKLSWLWPNTHFIIPFRDLALTGYGLGDVIGDIIWTLGFAALMIILAVFLFQKRANDTGDKKASKKAFSFRKGRAEK